ncbi:unnamed protein product [Arabidopsis lyrata]|nr:unnamed protein product [Arabidopsis lyrata]
MEDWNILYNTGRASVSHYHCYQNLMKINVVQEQQLERIVPVVYTIWIMCQLKALHDIVVSELQL